MVKSFCLHSLGFRGEKIIIEGCELSVIEKNGTWEVVTSGRDQVDKRAGVAAGSP